MCISFDKVLLSPKGGIITGMSNNKKTNNNNKKEKTGEKVRILFFLFLKFIHLLIRFPRTQLFKIEK